MKIREFRYYFPTYNKKKNEKKVWKFIRVASSFAFVSQIDDNCWSVI